MSMRKNTLTDFIEQVSKALDTKIADRVSTCDRCIRKTQETVLTPEMRAELNEDLAFNEGFLNGLIVAADILEKHSKALN